MLMEMIMVSEVELDSVILLWRSAHLGTAATLWRGHQTNRGTSRIRTANLALCSNHYAIAVLGDKGEIIDIGFK